MKRLVILICFFALGARPALALDPPGIDIPDFQRAYLSRPPPVVLWEDDFDDVSGWQTIPSEGSSIEAARDKGEDGGCLCLRYTVTTSGWCAVKKTVTPFTVSGGCGVAMRVRLTNPAHGLDVKLIDADGGFFGCLGMLDPSYLEWKELVIRPEEVQYLFGGSNTAMDEIRHVDLAVSARGTAGSGEVFVDSLRIAEDRGEYAEIALSQIGYHPADRKRCVLRVVSDAPPAGALRYSVEDALTGKTVLEGAFEPSDFSRWTGRYFTADFSGLSAPGTYRLRVPVGREALWSSPFEVGSNVFLKGVSPQVVTFLRCMHCGDRCHPRDPILGGYHDTFYDIGKRMWSLTHLILGLALTVEAGGTGDLDRNRTDDAMDELLYALRYAFAVQLPDGGVGSFGIGHDVPNGTMVDTAKFRFEEDVIPRVLDRFPRINTTCYYVGALCRAHPLVSNAYPVVAGEVMAHARRAADYLLEHEKEFETSYEHGGFAYAMMEMCRLTGERRWLERVPDHLALLAALQDLDSSDKEIPVCGDFVLSPEKREFEYQYKYFEYNLEIPLGLANVVELYDPASPEWLRAAYMLGTFRRCYLEPMASLTPYRQLAHGMERDGDGYRVAFFPPPTQPWTGAHGLNVDHLALGYLAMRAGHLLDDPWCEDFADDQVQWVLGQNPLRYCMVCGAGANNPKVWSSMNNKGGPWVGEMINGIVGDRLAFPIWIVIFSSGENWLPHNAYFLALSGLLERPARVSGRVAGSGGSVVVYDGDTPVRTLPVGADGRFGPAELPPQREYRARYEGTNGWAERRFVLLSGEEEKVSLDPSETYDVRLSCAGKDAQTARVEFVVENRCGRDIRMPLVLRAFDGVAESKEAVDVSVPAGKRTRLEREFAFRDGQPLLAAVGRRTLLIPYR